MDKLPPTFPPVPHEEITPTDVLLARSNMRSFMRVVAPGYVDMWGCGVTCDLLTRVARRVRGRTGDDTLDALFLFGPPQHWKSYLMGQYFPAFVAAQRGDVRILNLCHNRDLANRAIRDFCTVLDLANYREVSRVRYGRVQTDEGSVREEAGAKRVRFLAQFQDGAVEPTNGYYLSSSVEGGSTGWGANLGLGDDLIPDPESAESPAQRRKLENVVRSVFFTRMQVDSALVMSMTPWYKGDIGEVAEGWCRSAGLRVESLSLPAVAEPGIPLHPLDLRTPGGGQILDPYRHSAAFYAARRVLMGPYFWATMWQTVRGANTSDLVDPSAWKSYDPNALRLRTVDLVDIVLAVDPNGKEDGPCDCHVSLWAVVRRGDVRLEAWKLGEWHGAWSYDVVKRTVGRLRAAWPVGHIVVEQNNYGTSLVSELINRTPFLDEAGKPYRYMRKTPHIEPVNPRSPKPTRAKRQRPLIEAGLARLPSAALGEVSTDWTDDHRKGWKSWPGPQKSDLDRTDCDAMALDYIQGEWHLIEAHVMAEGVGGSHR